MDSTDLLAPVLGVSPAPFFAVALGWAVLVLGGLGLMVIDIAAGRTERIWSAGLIVAAIAYAGVNVVVFAGAFSVDPKTVSEPRYAAAIAFAGPALAIHAVLIVAGTTSKLGWSGVLGFALWTIGVGFLHVWVVYGVGVSLK